MRKVYLENICDIKIGRTPPRKQPQWFSESHGIKWASIKDMGNTGKYISQTSEFLTADAIKKFNIPIIPAGTLLMSFKLTVGRLGFTEYDMCSNEAIAQLPIKDPDIVDKNYLYYYLKNFNFGSLSSTSSIATAVNSKTVKNISVNLPPLDQQKKITNILGSLDEKIKFNRRMNETLEQLGQALFCHYFVDNHEARNWKRGVISDLGEVVTGKTPSKKNQKFFGDEMAFLKVPDMHKTSIVIKTSDNLSLAGAESQKAKYIPKWSTCVSCIATVGVVSLAGKNMQTNQQINSIVPREPYFKFFNYFLMRHKADYIKTLASGGSVAPNLNRGNFSNITVAMPDRELLKEFDTRVSHLFLQMENNLQENETLINIRDSLLPKLISGEIEA